MSSRFGNLWIIISKSDSVVNHPLFQIVPFRVLKSFCCWVIGFAVIITQIPHIFRTSMGLHLSLYR